MKYLQGEDAASLDFPCRKNIIHQYSFIQYYIVENFATYALVPGIREFSRPGC